MSWLAGCKAVVFDLFQTLIPVRPGRPLSVLICDVAGVDERDCRLDWRAVYDAAADGRYPCVEQVIRDACRDLGKQPDEAKLRGAVEERTSRHHFGFGNVDPAIPEMLRALKRSGLRLALLTNSDAKIVSPFPTSPFADLFDVTVFSHEVGVAKPEPAIFRLVCERLGLPPGECLFVGDGANREFDGAKAVGMKTALVMRYADPRRRPEWSGACDFVLEDLGELLIAE